MLYLSRLRSPLVLFVLLLLISACALPPLRQIDLSQFRLPTIELKRLAKTPLTPDAATEVTLENFSNQLISALEQHDYTQLQALMSDSFVMADWRAKGRTLPSQVALVQLRNRYLLPGRDGVFSSTVANTEEWATWLGGTDPLPSWDASAKSVKAIYVTGLSVDLQTEALLLVAQQPNGTPYWHSMVVAPEGFQPKLATGAVITTHRTATNQRGQSDQPRLINIVPGAATAKVSGVLYPGQRNYLVRALAGQQLMVNVASLNDQAALTISSHGEGQKLRELANGLHAWTATVPATQDYLITINTDVATPFELITTLDEAQSATIVEPTPVQGLFASGASATTITKQVVSPERHRLRTVPGPTLQDTPAAAANRASFAIQGITDDRQ